MSDPSPLLARVATGDRVALVSLYREWGPRVHGWLAARLPPADAARATEEVFVRIWRSAATLGQSRLGAEAWMHTVARDVWFERVRGEALARPEPDDPTWVDARAGERTPLPADLRATPP